MMDRMLDFPQRDVEHAMVPRAQVDWVEPDITLDELRVLMARAHTRYPVIDDEDAPVGVVHLADVLKCLESGLAVTGLRSWPAPAPPLGPLARSIARRRGGEPLGGPRSPIF